MMTTFLLGFTLPMMLLGGGLWLLLWLDCRRSKRIRVMRRYVVDGEVKYAEI